MAVVTRMTAADFLELPESNNIIELIDGEVVVSPSPSYDRQIVVGQTYQVIIARIPDGRVLLAPMDVHLDDTNVMEPAIFWVSDKNERCILIDRKYFRSAPDLIAEVLSPGTTRIDRKQKFELYEKYGVRQYWMLEPVEQYIEVWVRDGDKFTRLGIHEAEETFHSPVLGEVEVNQLFAA